MTKRYLKTPEEVIQALKEGKVVEDVDYIYKLIDGVVCSHIKGRNRVPLWGVGVMIYQSDKPYVEEPKPLKLEVGKFYKTRDGRKAWIVEGTVDDTFPFRVAAQKECAIYTVTEGGKRFSEGMSGADLVAPWEEQ